MRRKLMIGSGLGVAFVVVFLLGAMAVGAVLADDSNSELANLAQITAEEAEATALGEFPGATITEVELERENGLVVYGVEVMTTEGQEYEVEVDAVTGEVVEIESEDDEDDDVDYEDEDENDD